MHSIPRWFIPVVLGTLLLTVGGCNSGYTGNDPTGSSTPYRAEALLAPVIAVDASGRADYLDQSGFNGDRLEVEIEIDQGDFAAVGIDEADGFDDEAVTIAVTRGGVGILPLTSLAFSLDRRATQGDITFEVALQGAGVPQFLRGDVAEVVINGTLVLQGTFVPR